MAVSVSTSPTFEFGKPKLLFKAPDSFPVSGTPGGLASISRDGQRFALVVPPPPRLRQITVLDRQGKTVRKVGEPGLYDLPALSPDGTRVAVVRSDPATNNVDIWSIDMTHGQGHRNHQRRRPGHHAHLVPGRQTDSVCVHPRAERNILEHISQSRGWIGKRGTVVPVHARREPATHRYFRGREVPGFLLRRSAFCGSSDGNGPVGPQSD